MILNSFISFGIIFDDDAKILFSNMEPSPKLDQKKAINNAIISLRDSGIWYKLDRFCIMTGASYASQQQGLIDWKDSTKSLSLNGSSSWTPSDGYVGDNSTGSYADTSFAPSIDGINYTLNDAGFGTYIASVNNHGDPAGVSIGGAIGVYEQPSPINFNFTHAIS